MSSGDGQGSLPGRVGSGNSFGTPHGNPFSTSFTAELGSDSISTLTKNGTTNLNDFPPPGNNAGGGESEDGDVDMEDAASEHGDLDGDEDAGRKAEQVRRAKRSRGKKSQIEGDTFNEVAKQRQAAQQAYLDEGLVEGQTGENALGADDDEDEYAAMRQFESDSEDENDNPLRRDTTEHDLSTANAGVSSSHFLQPTEMSTTQKGLHMSLMGFKNTGEFNKLVRKEGFFIHLFKLFQEYFKKSGHSKILSADELGKLESQASMEQRQEWADKALPVDHSQWGLHDWMLYMMNNIDRYMRDRNNKAACWNHNWPASVRQQRKYLFFKYFNEGMKVANLSGEDYRNYVVDFGNHSTKKLDENTPAVDGENPAPTFAPERQSVKRKLLGVAQTLARKKSQLPPRASAAHVAGQRQHASKKHAAQVAEANQDDDLARKNLFEQTKKWIGDELDEEAEKDLMQFSLQDWEEFFNKVDEVADWNSLAKQFVRGDIDEFKERQPIPEHELDRILNESSTGGDGEEEFLEADLPITKSYQLLIICKSLHRKSFKGFRSLKGRDGTDRKGINRLKVFLECQQQRLKEQTMEKTAEELAKDNADAQEQAEGSKDDDKKKPSEGIDSCFVPLAHLAVQSDQTEFSELLATEEFERTRFDSACRKLRIRLEKKIEDGTIEGIRTKFMSKAIALFWWQPVGSYNLLEIAKSKCVRGGLLADKVGTGKTITLATVMLHDWSEYWNRVNEIRFDDSLTNEQRRAAKKANGFYKPWIVFVPNTLLPQWTTELHELSSRFDIHVYHGDSSKIKSNQTYVKAITTKLKPDSEALQPSFDKCKVILTTTSTFINTHGSNPAKTHYNNVVSSEHLEDGVDVGDFDTTNDTKWGKLHSEYKCCTDPTHAFPYDLSGHFQGVLVDEAHLLKGEDTQANNAIVNLDASQVHLATATPLINGIAAIKGYLTMLQRPDCKKKYSEKQKENGKYNPYEIAKPTEDDIMAMCSADAFEDWVLRPAYTGKAADKKAWQGLEKLTPSQQGICARKVLKYFYIRRTYPTHIPSQKEQTRIGKNLPPIKHYRMNEQMTPECREVYTQQTDRYTARIYKPDEKLQKGAKAGQVETTVALNSNAQRALSLASLCPLFLMIGVPLRHESLPDDHKLIEKVHVRNRVDMKSRDVYGHGLSTKNQLHSEETTSQGGKESKKDQSVPLPPWEPYWYRQDEWGFAEIDNTAFLKYYRDRAPPGKNPYVYMMEVVMRRIYSHEDKGPFGDRLCGREIVSRYMHTEIHNGEKVLCFPDPATVEGRSAMIRLFTDFSPRLDSVLGLVGDAVIRREKAALWVNYPVEQLLLNGFLALTGVQSLPFMASLSPTARLALIKDFNTDLSPARHHHGEVQFLVCSYSVGGVGLNLQDACHLCFLVLSAATDAAIEQAIGRFFRLGQTHAVHVVFLFTSFTNDEKVMARNMKRAMTDIMTSLDREALADAVHGMKPDEDGERKTTSTPLTHDDISSLYIRKDPEKGDKLVLFNTLSPEEQLRSYPATPEQVLQWLYGRKFGVQVRTAKSKKAESKYDYNELKVSRSKTRESRGGMHTFNNYISSKETTEFEQNRRYVPPRAEADVRDSRDKDAKSVSLYFSGEGGKVEIEAAEMRTSPLRPPGSNGPGLQDLVELEHSDLRVVDNLPGPHLPATAKGKTGAERAANAKLRSKRDKTHVEQATFEIVGGHADGGQPDAHQFFSPSAARMQGEKTMKSLGLIPKQNKKNDKRFKSDEHVRDSDDEDVAPTMPASIGLPLRASSVTPQSPVGTASDAGSAAPASGPSRSTTHSSGVSTPSRSRPGPPAPTPSATSPPPPPVAPLPTQPSLADVTIGVFQKSSKEPVYQGQGTPTNATEYIFQTFIPGQNSAFTLPSKADVKKFNAEALKVLRRDIITATGANGFAMSIPELKDSGETLTAQRNRMADTIEQLRQVAIARLPPAPRGADGQPLTKKVKKN